MKKSRVYKVEEKLFRYDYDNCIVEWVTKASKEELKDNAEWLEKYGKPLFDIDEHGYITNDGIGLRLENWKNKEVREEYLAEWANELNYEAECLVNDFIKYELKYYL